MVTEISGSVITHTAIGRAEVLVQTPPTPVQLRDTVRNEAPQPPAEQSPQISADYARLRLHQDGLNQAAAVLRDVRATLDKTGNILDAMGKDIATIVKMYPPYPLDNPERYSLLNNFSSLRRQIDELTFPPPERLQELQHILGNEGQGKGVAAMGLPGRIPVLDPAAASDEEVKNALDQIKAAKSALDGTQTGIWKDVANFVRQAESPDVHNQGTETRRLLAGNSSVQGIVSDTRQLIGAMG